ncbi:MAG: hypothetical protein QG636_640 [Patescibacteria group bacterium]|nr:hypothetical protein [Patescibacteria group bacterium]
MRNVLIALALLFFGWAVAGPASAGQYKGYYYGAQSPTEIAVLVERSLATDPTGRTMLDAAKCRRDGSCAAPINYVESFRAHDPRGNVTLQNLGAYLRSLRIDCTISGRYQMDRIIFRSGTLGQTDVNGMSRSFLRNECAWVNPETGRPVLAQNCANPVGMEVNLECVYENIEVRNPAESSVIWSRYNRENDPCFAYRRVSRLYEPDSPRAVWQEVPNGCVGRPCDFTAVNRSLGRQQVAQGEIQLDSPGFYQIRLSPDELLVLCLKLRVNGQVVGSSFASGTRWQQDYQRIGREWHARVYYESDEVVADGLTLNGPRGLTFWASDREDEAVMNGLARPR